MRIERSKLIEHIPMEYEYDYCRDFIDWKTLEKLLTKDTKIEKICIADRGIFICYEDLEQPFENLTEEEIATPDKNLNIL